MTRGFPDRASDSLLGQVLFRRDQLFTMLSQKLIFILLASTGFIAFTKAEINVTITSYEPKSPTVFGGDEIKLTCEVFDSDGAPGKTIITWHQNDVTSQALKNSSTTKITSWTEGNKVISSFSTSVADFKRPANFFHVYCKGDNGKSRKYMNHPFTYVKERPRLRVQVPETQAVAEGSRYHNLVCLVSSNVNINPVTAKWIFASQTLKEKTVDLKTNKTVNFSLPLTSLTEKDFGSYTCAVNASKYYMQWHDSATTNLTGNVPGNTATNISPGFVQLSCLPLIMRFFLL